MHDVDALRLTLEIVMGLSLSAACGLRAFLPLFAMGVCERAGYLTLGSHFHWLGATPSLIVFGSAVIFEMLGDKIPAVDHALDAAGLVVKPVAGAMLASAAIVHMDPLLSAVLGLIAGGSMSAGVHVVKANARLVSSAVTAGFANPVISVLEDLLVVFLTALAIMAPFVAFAVVLVLGYVTWRVVRRIFRRRKTTLAAA